MIAWLTLACQSPTTPAPADPRDSAECTCSSTTPPLEPVRLAVGSSDGHVRLYAVDANGRFEEREVEYAGQNPSFLAFDAAHTHLYAVDEGASELVAFSLDPDSDELTLLNRVPANGSGPAHLTVDATGRWLLAANYGSGTVTSVAIAEDGSLGAAAASPYAGAHAHQIVLDPSNAFAFVPALGDDRIVQLRFDEDTGALTPNAVPYVDTAVDAGPRHLAFHPREPYAYGVNELDVTVVTYQFDPYTGALGALQTLSALPPGAVASTGAEIAVHPNGELVYASIRGADTIAIFTISDQGTLAPAGFAPTGGETPRHFSLSPSGDRLFVGNQGAGEVAVFAVDPHSGSLDAQRVVTVIGPSFVGAF